MVACYLAESRLPTDESHRLRNKRRKVPLGFSAPGGDNVRTLLNDIILTDL